MNGRPQYTFSETVFHNVSSEVYCGLLYLCNKRNNTTSRSTRNCVPQRKVVSGCLEHTMLFLYLWNLGNKKCHRAATRNCVPQRKVVSDCLEHTVLFLHLWNLGSKKCHKATRHNRVPQRKSVSV